MSKEDLQKRLDATIKLIAQTESAYQQMLGRKFCLEELLIETEKGKKDEKEATGTVS